MDLAPASRHAVWVPPVADTAPRDLCADCGVPRLSDPKLGRLMPRMGPRGLEFARARVETKTVETVLHLHLRRDVPRRLRTVVPAHVRALVAPCGLAPTVDELPRAAKPADPVDPA